jgi:hypothetical protein
MSNVWNTFAENYAKFDTPLKPNSETFGAIKESLHIENKHRVAVLGSTPLFENISDTVSFIDASPNSLSIVDGRPGVSKVNKDWLEAESEYQSANFILGDGSFNALGSPERVFDMLVVLADNMKAGARQAQRIFIQHNLEKKEFQDLLVLAFEEKNYSEVRFLIYGFIVNDKGVAPIIGIESFIQELAKNLSISDAIAEEYKRDYFFWRNMSGQAAKDNSSTIFIPTLDQIEEIFSAKGFATNSVVAGSFPLARYTPIFITD